MCQVHLLDQVILWGRAGQANLNQGQRTRHVTCQLLLKLAQQLLDCREWQQEAWRARLLVHTYGQGRSRGLGGCK